MKEYIKKQHSGNENGWSKEGVEVSRHHMHESQAAELNKAFGSTGVKYEEAGAEKPKVAKDETKSTEQKKAAPAKNKKAEKPKVEKEAEHKAE